MTALAPAYVARQANPTCVVAVSAGSANRISSCRRPARIPESHANRNAGKMRRLAAGGFYLDVLDEYASWVIRSHNSGNEIPAAAAACGMRLVSVIPGRVFASRSRRTCRTPSYGNRYGRIP